MSSRAFGIGVLLSAACAGCGPAGDRPDPRTWDEAAAAAGRVGGPLAILTEPVPSDERAGGAFPPGTQFVSPDPTQIERVRDAHTVIAPPAFRTRLELLGYQLAEIPEADGWIRIDRRLHCASVRSTSWSPLPGLEFSGRIGIDLPGGAGGEMVLVVGDHGPVRLTAEASSGTGIPLSMEPLQNAPGTASPPADFWLDQTDPHQAPPVVVRVRLPAAANDRRLVGVRFGRRAPRVLARLAGFEGDARARVCAAPLGGEHVVTAGTRGGDVALDQQELFGAGWHGEETGSAGRIRWAGRDAALLLSSDAAGPVTLEIEAMPPAGTLPSLTPVVNGVPLAAAPLGSGLGTYAWRVPEGLWLVGTNEVVLRVSATVEFTDRAGTSRRELGLGVKAARVRLVP